MAMVVRVKPEYNGKIAVQSSNNYNGLILSNNLSQETLVQIYNTEDELRDFLYTEYTTAVGSYAPSQIDPSLIHAYASEEITHNPVKTDYPANTLGKHLNETRGKIDAFDNAFLRPNIKPSFVLDFANARFLDPRIPFSRNSIGTYIDKNGVLKIAPVNAPRFHHDINTKEILGLLREEKRTNINPYSNDISTASGYLMNNLTPQGTTKFIDQSSIPVLTESLVSGQQFVFSKGNIPISAGASIAFSCFVKNIQGNRNILLEVSKNGNRFSAQFNVLTGTLINQGGVGSASFGGYIIEPWGDYYRIGVIGRLDGTSTSITFQFSLLNGTQQIYSGDGSRVAVAGVQLEEGDTISSLIPTGSNAVTRESDIISISGGLFNELFPLFSQGTLYIEARKAETRAIGNKKMYHQLLNSNNDSIGLSDDTNGIYHEVIKDSVNTFSSAASIVNKGEYFKGAFAFRTNFSKSSINGILSPEDVTINYPGSLDSYQIGNGMSTIIKQVAFWGICLPDAILASLTKNGLAGKGTNNLPSIGDLQGAAFVSPFAILRAKSRQEFSIDGTGASVTRNIRRGYDFTFEIVDSTGVTLTAQPASSCTAGTDNALTFTAPLGKTLTYAITPVFEY